LHGANGRIAGCEKHVRICLHELSGILRDEIDMLRKAAVVDPEVLAFDKAAATKGFEQRLGRT
jgi:hypothetical protein